MAKNNRRKLFLFGRYSLALLLPKRWLKELAAERGDEVTLQFNKKRHQITIEFGLKNSSSGAKSDSSTPSSKKKKADGEDWQPIPQL